VQNGGSIMIAVGTSASHRARIPIFGGYSSEARSYLHDASGTVGETDSTSPVMNDANWADLKIYYAAKVDAGQARVLARLTDGTPLLLDKQVGEGHVLLFTSGFDNLTNDFPVRPAFVPFIDKASRYLSGSDSTTGVKLVDSFVPLRTQAKNSSTGVEIIGPDGHRALSLKEAAAAQSFELVHAGFYHIHFANGKDALIAVNPDRRESNLEPIPADVLQLWGGHPSSPVSAPVSVEEKNTARSLWWYVMLLVLVAAVAESIVASRYLGTQREEA
jgi:hypothetical protein